MSDENEPKQSKKQKVNLGKHLREDKIRTLTNKQRKKKFNPRKVWPHNPRLNAKQKERERQKQKNNFVTIKIKDKAGNVKSEEKVPLDELWHRKPHVAIEMAKRDFMCYDNVRAIARRYGMPYERVCWYSYSHAKPWRKERDSMENHLVRDVLKNNKKDLEDIVGLSAAILKRILTRYEAQEAPKSIEEATKLSQLMSNVHKVMQLEKNRPTEITMESKDIPDLIKEIEELDEYCDYGKGKTGSGSSDPVVN